MIEPRIIRRAEDCDSALAALRQTMLEHLRNSDRPLAVWLRPYSPPRNTEQNSRLWWLHGLMAAHLNERVPDMIAAKLLPKFFGRFTAESVHEGIFKPKYCGTRPDGTPRSSTRLSKLDFADAMSRYEADMVNEGVEIPENPLGDAGDWR